MAERADTRETVRPNRQRVDWQAEAQRADRVRGLMNRGRVARSHWVTHWRSEPSSYSETLDSKPSSRRGAEHSPPPSGRSARSASCAVAQSLTGVLSDEPVTAVAVTLRLVLGRNGRSVAPSRWPIASLHRTRLLRGPGRRGLGRPLASSLVRPGGADGWGVDSPVGSSAKRAAGRSPKILEKVRYNLPMKEKARRRVRGLVGEPLAQEPSARGEVRASIAKLHPREDYAQPTQRVRKQISRRRNLDPTQAPRTPLEAQRNRIKKPLSRKAVALKNSNQKVRSNRARRDAAAQPRRDSVALGSLA